MVVKAAVTVESKEGNVSTNFCERFGSLLKMAEDSWALAVDVQEATTPSFQVS